MSCLNFTKLPVPHLASEPGGLSSSGAGKAVGFTDPLRGRWGAARSVSPVGLTRLRILKPDTTSSRLEGKAFP